ncbi:putative zinc-type alcohol dehydrogenase-like protein C16A3.02c [Mytilinidion resinicola]|uniref:Zinc-type alcohol dehydrogenase-like protein C16A3.02c n=1 Tax=Mytilinidion resinicola TaxID=574789 RepID=A0A6A6YEU4_9PEZI|nr:putative zinc-type alcohol dehydrogenase-like protein C16A3.02c [Mytilinidion resinicola]KAF2807129.1 putative zinc-type alcohol dehydrogenase-like protein C16A3.02c [Mytilinidion resinicola]
MALPTTMKAWQYTTTKGGLIPNLKLNPTASFPTPKDPSTQHIVQIFSTCLNPVDVKPAEGLPSFMLPKPATPGIDFVGKLVVPAKNSDLKAGQVVFGGAGLSPFAGGACAEYAIADIKALAALPAGLRESDAATIGVAGMTAYQTIVPHVKANDRIFINGGSGGVGVFGIQIAKAVGCHVTTACSTANVELCKSLGADDVIDYKKGSVVEALKSKPPFDHVVDNVGSDPNLYWKAHEYMKKSAKFVGIAGEPSLKFVIFTAKVRLWPGFLGGGKRKFEGFFAQQKIDDLLRIAGWMKEGKVRAVVDERFPFEKLPDAVRRLKTGRARGKVMVDVTAGDGKA